MSPDHAESSRQLAQLAARVAERLGRAAAAVALPENVPAPLHVAYEEAAAVQSWFNLEALRPAKTATHVAELREVTDHLLLNANPVEDERGIRRWTLKTPVRISALRRLRESGLLQQIRKDNRGPENDSLQRALDAGLDGGDLPCADSAMDQVRASLEVANWLQAAGFVVSPPVQRIAARIDWLNLLQPFEHLGGDHFRGRAAELKALRKFVGVLPPQSILQAVDRAASAVVASIRQLFGRSDEVAIVISGPGGVGKSSLVGRFILEHAKAHESDRFPFAYIDFDRADISVEEPLTVLAEAVRQIGVQYVELRDSCERLRTSWLEKLGDAAGGSGKSVHDLRAAAVHDAVAVLERLTGGDRPVVLVLDTFEEVQFGGERIIGELWQFLVALRVRIAPLRIVIAGRAEIGQPGVVSMLLSAFDEESAMAYLSAQGVSDDKVAKQIFRQFGGSPMTLKLAAEIIARDNGDVALGQIDTHGLLFNRIADEQVQRQLYRRVLGHIHDADVRRLVHPGLLLRRISPELILQVLAGPCGIAVADLEAADRLFAKLKREVALVTVESKDVVSHRQDLRSLMLEPLQRDDPENARRVHEAAVAYYAKRTADSDAAEEIYHRLWMDESQAEIRSRWRDSLGPALQSAMADFDLRRRARLAALTGSFVDEETRRAADLEDWEQIVVTQLRPLRGRSQPESAQTLKQQLRLLEERSERSAQSPLVATEAELLARSGQPDRALAQLSQAFRRALQVGAIDAASCFAVTFADGVIALGRRDQAQLAVQQFEQTTSHGGSAEWFVLDVAALGGRLAELGAQTTLPPISSTRLDELFQRFLTSGEPARQRSIWWAASADLEGADNRLLALVEVTGLPRVSNKAKRQLAAEIARADLAYSKAAGRKPGQLAQLCRVPMKSSLIESWIAFALQVWSSRLSAAMESILRCRLDEQVRTRLVRSIQEIFVTALAATWTVALSRPRESQGIGRTSGFSDPDLLDLILQISREFNYHELREVLSHRIDRSLDAYVSVAPMGSVAKTLVGTADREGWLNSLIAALIEARPHAYDLAVVANRFGVSSITADAAAMPEYARMPAAARGAWLAWLGLVQHAICRVEVGDTSWGTGFLVGPDLVLTAHRLIDQASDNSLSDIRARFDYRNFSVSGVDRVNAFRCLARVAGSRELDYALLRVEGAPGVQPIGGIDAESGAWVRRWIDVPKVPQPLVAGMSLVIAQYAKDQSLVVASGTLLSTDPFEYSVTKQIGSSGAPCFDLATHQLVAVIQSIDLPDGTTIHGRTIAAILADAARQGFDLESLLPFF